MAMNKNASSTVNQESSPKSFCLVLAIWGDAFSDTGVNTIVQAVKKNSEQLHSVVLLTDRQRSGVDPYVNQHLFPDFFNRPEFFGHGYRVKISMFSKSVLPPSMPCVYLDLDTLVLGDFGKIACLVKRPCDVFMLPPGNLITFGIIRRLLFRLTAGRWFATGNSSVVAFHSDAEPNFSDLFQQRFLSGDTSRYMKIDDVFISWIGQLNLLDIPPGLAVPFRREFLSRYGLVLWLRKVSWSRKFRRDHLIAITFNGAQYKPAELLGLKEGQRILDRKGRFGYWSNEYMGSLRQKIIDYCQKVI